MDSEYRESIILSFDTAGNRTRTLRIPDPQSDLDAGAVYGAGRRMVNANLFDGYGALAELVGAQLERVTTRTLV